MLTISRTGHDRTLNGDANVLFDGYPFLQFANAECHVSQARHQLLPNAGRKIVFLDFSGCKATDLPPAIAEAKRRVSIQPKESALILMNVSDVELARETSQLLNDCSMHNTPYVKASAVVGVEGLICSPACGWPEYSGI